MRKVEFFTYDDVVKMAESTDSPVDAVEFLNALLAERGRVFHKSVRGDWYEVPENGCYGRDDTHRMIAIDIQPIVRESAEDVLRDYVKAVQEQQDRKIDWSDIYLRAKRALKE